MEVATIRWNHDTGWAQLPTEMDSPSTMVLVFGDRELADDPEPLQELADAFPTSIVTGCSAAGQILGSALVDGAPVAAVARFDHVRVRSTSGDARATRNSHALGCDLGRQLADDDLRLVVLLSDGLAVNGSALVDGIATTAGSSVPITGGLAGDGDRFGTTWVLDQGVCRPDRVVAVGLYGDELEISSGSEGGWGIFGPARTVTRSAGNVLHELDGQPALELYKRYLGELSSQLPASALLFPLAIRPPSGGDPLVRTVLAVDEEQQSMTFAGDIPEGWHAQLMRSSADRLVDGAGEAGAQCAAGSSGAGAALHLAVSCVGRRLVLGQRTEEELDATIDALPAGSELIGFYSYGEIAPGARGSADLHNQTMTLTSLSERSSTLGRVA